MKTRALILLVLLLLTSRASAAGLLVPRDGSPPIAIRSHRVDAKVTDGIARTTVRQTFVNPGANAVEAIYLFPLPDGASLTAVAMETGGQRYEGLLAERKRARAVYNEIVRRREDPALVEQVGRNAFRLSVFPVLPKKETVVELSYTQPVPLAGDSYRYVYALGDDRAASTAEQDLTLTVRMVASAGLESVAASTTDTHVIRQGPGEFLVSLEKPGAKLDRDIVVTGVLADNRPVLSVDTFRDKKGDGYFVAVITPPRASENQLIPRDVILVMDTSGSMGGDKIDQARASALYLLSRLRPADRVNIVRFSSDVRRYSEELVSPTVENLTGLEEFVKGLVAVGSTNIGEALRMAIEGEKAPGRVRTVVFLTDGIPTIGEQNPEALIQLAKAGRAAGFRVFPFGVGGDVDAGLLRGLAKASGGKAEIFRTGGEIETRLGSFLDRTSAPVIADIVFDAGLETYDVFPRPLPDLYLGEQLLIAGRYESGGVVQAGASGTMSGRKVARSVAVEYGKEPGGSAAVRDLFARMKLDYLEGALRLRRGLSDEAYYAALDRGAYSTQDEIVEEIIHVSLTHQVQSAYTSFLVLLPEDRHRIDPRNLAALKGAMDRAGRSRRDLLGDFPVARSTGRTNRPRKGLGPDIPDRRPIELDDTVLEEPVIKDAKVSDHNETDHDEPFAESLGEKDFISDAPFDGPESKASVGIGGGAGGAFGGRGGRRNMVARGGGSRITENAVDLGLEWLKNHQDPGGFWDCDGFMKQDKVTPACDGAGNPLYDPGVSGLALLAFLGAGETHKHGRYRKTVREGLRYLKQIQDPEGCFGPRTTHHFTYNHAIAALAMSEAYGLTLSPLFKHSAQQGIDFIQKCQNPYLAWRYGIRPGDNDTSVSVWMIMALKSAKISGLRIDPSTFKGMRQWLERVTDPEYGRVGYTTRGSGPARPTDLMDRFPAERSESLTAVGILVRIFTGEDPARSEMIMRGTELCLKALPVWDETSGAIDMYYWYYGTLAMFQVGDDAWRKWNEAIKDAVIPNQRKGPPSFRGSWDPVGPWGREGGRVYSTAMMVMCKEVYYRYRQVFGAGR